MLTAVVAALLMEPVAALTHRLVMHRPRGWAWHRSHHAPRRPERWTEANDRFPLVFAIATVAVIAAGGPGVRRAGGGVAAYGLSYAVVHDVCIHGRLTGGRPVVRGAWLRHVAAAHAVHHRHGRAPYGFLVPIVPARLRAATATFRAVGTRARREKTS